MRFIWPIARIIFCPLTLLCIYLALAPQGKDRQEEKLDTLISTTNNESVLSLKYWKVVKEESQTLMIDKQPIKFKASEKVFS